MNKQTAFSLSLLLASTGFLPQCDWLKFPQKKQDAPAASTPVTSDDAAAPTGEALVTMNGAVIATVNDFNTWLDRFLTIQPQYKPVVEAQPELKIQLADNFIVERTLSRWVVAQGIDKSAEYLKDLADIQELAKQQLAMKYFQLKYAVDVAADEAKKYYEENKLMPGIKLSDGGVVTQSIKFSTEPEAKAFLDVVKDVSVDFEKAAKDKNLVLKNYKEVHDKRFDVAEPVRTKVLELKTFPAVAVVKVDDNTFEVIKAFKKEAAQYVPFEQVKDQIEAFLKQQKMQKMFESGSKELEEIRKDLGIQINTDALSRISGAKSKDAQAMNMNDMSDDEKVAQADNIMQSEEMEVVS